MDTRRRQMDELGLKNGGLVRGPGTGTSDSIKTEVPEGSYIMPADSTRSLGPGALSHMGDEPVPVNLSNGEYALPPQQVHAIGVQALDRMKNATHSPAHEAARAAVGTKDAGGFRPGLFFADGGLVEDEKRTVAQQLTEGANGGFAPGGAPNWRPPARPSATLSAPTVDQTGAPAAPAAAAPIAPPTPSMSGYGGTRHERARRRPAQAKAGIATAGRNAHIATGAPGAQHVGLRRHKCARRCAACRHARNWLSVWLRRAWFQAGSERWRAGPAQSGGAVRSNSNPRSD
jgi:hypothetical protein